MAYSFRCNETAGTTVNNLHYFTEDPQTSGSVLDFAWNNERVQFNTSADTTVATGTFGPRTDFNYSGNANQLTNDWSQWRTTTNDIENSPFGLVDGFLPLSKEGKIKDALMRIFKEPGKEILELMGDDDKKLLEAKRKSEKLLKSWLTKAEYDALVNRGEVEIPSEEDDVIFIVKRDPNEMVDVKKKGKFSHKLCAVAEDMDYPVGDQLLSKIVLLKTDEDKFKRIAIKHGGSVWHGEN